MSLPPLFGPLLGAVIGGALFGAVAWRRATATMYYRSANSTIRPPHIALGDYEAWVMARRKRTRLLRVLGAALAGAVLGGLLLTMIGAGLARK